MSEMLNVSHVTTDEKNPLQQTAVVVDDKEAKRHFSRLGIAVFTILGVCTIGQMLLGFVGKVTGNWLEHPWGMWLMTFVPLYLIAIPCGLLLLRRIPAKPVEKQTLQPKRYLILVMISFFMMYLGNLVGLIVTSCLGLLLGNGIGNPVLDMVTGTAVLPRVLFVVILAPLLEEYVFRKQLIDRMHIYGEKQAVIVSALLFGLFHGNLSQMFYAFTLGLVFGYVYLKTGKLRYSVGLHMMINLMSGVIGSVFLEKMTKLEAGDKLDFATQAALTQWTAAYGIYVCILLGMVIAGMVLFFIHKRNVSFALAEQELPKGSVFQTIYLNVGMLLFVAACFVLVVVGLL